MKLRSASALLRCGNKSTAPVAKGRTQVTPAFPPASHALAITDQLTASCQGFTSSPKSPNTRNAQRARFLCSDMLDSPEARLSFDLRASRLMDPICKGRPQPVRWSSSSPQVWQRPPAVRPCSADSPHPRCKWPGNDDSSLTIDDQQQGTGNIGSFTTVLMDNTNSSAESAGRSCNAGSADVLSQASSPAFTEDEAQTTAANVSGVKVETLSSEQLHGCHEAVRDSTLFVPESSTQMDTPDVRRQAGNDSAVLSCGSKSVVHFMQQVCKTVMLSTSCAT